jgi:hypothetical protein
MGMVSNVQSLLETDMTMTRDSEDRRSDFVVFFEDVSDQICSRIRIPKDELTLSVPRHPSISEDIANFMALRHQPCSSRHIPVISEPPSGSCDHPGRRRR